MGCLSCIYAQRFDNKIRCWEQDSDNAMVITQEKAKRYKCSHYRNIKDKRCEDCKCYFNASCFNVNNAKVENNIIKLKWVSDTTKACEHFINKE